MRQGTPSVCVCVILTESIQIQSCLTPLVTLNISCSASSGVTVRSAVSLLACPSLSPQELCTSQSSSCALTGQRPHLRLCRFVQVCLHTLIPTRSLARDRESNIFTSASRACHCHVNGRVPLPVNNGPQMSVACTRINDETQSPSLIGNEKETNVFNSGFNKPDGASLDKITDESHVVTLAVLENRINATTGRSQLGFHTHPGQERAELLSNDTRLGAFVIHLTVIFHKQKISSDSMRCDVQSRIVQGGESGKAHPVKGQKSGSNKDVRCCRTRLSRG